MHPVTAERYSLTLPDSPPLLCPQWLHQILCELLQGLTLRGVWLSVRLKSEKTLQKTLVIGRMAFSQERRFKNWLNFFSAWLCDHRGSASRLAEFLGVPRQRVSTWFVLCYTRPPAWTIIACLEFFNLETTRVRTISGDHLKGADFSGCLEHFADLRDLQNRKPQLVEPRIPILWECEVFSFPVPVKLSSQLNLNLNCYENIIDYRRRNILFAGNQEHPTTV